MPKMVCNGFSMFANHCKPRIEAQRGRKFQRGMKELIEAATPLWKALPEEERKKWKDYSREYKKTEEYSERKRALRHSVNKGTPGNTSKVKPEPDSSDEAEEWDSEDDPGVPMVRSSTFFAPSATIRMESRRRGSEDGWLMEYGATEGSPKPLDITRQALEEKKQRDKKKLTEFFATETGGRLVDVKRCRFLLISMQTFGRLDDGVCIPAEIAVAEWSLAKGIMDEFHSIIVPWEIDNEVLRDRAEFNAYQSHKIPLEGCDMPDPKDPFKIKRNVLREVLGRSEPGIAGAQGVKVGLYQDGLVELTDVPTSEQAQREADDTGDLHGRRWIVCLQSEYESLMEGIRYLRNHLNIIYEGFPMTPDRFVFMDAVVEALAEFVHFPLPERFRNYLSALEEPDSDKYCTPWDKMEDVCCLFHRRDTPSPFCAQAIARKACLAGFHALKDGYALPVPDQTQ